MQKKKKNRSIVQRHARILIQSIVHCKSIICTQSISNCEMVDTLLLQICNQNSSLLAKRIAYPVYKYVKRGSLASLMAFVRLLQSLIFVQITNSLGKCFSIKCFRWKKKTADVWSFRVCVYNVYFAEWFNAIQWLWPI